MTEEEIMIDDEMESSLSLEKEEAGASGFFVSRRAKLLAKFPPKAEGPGDGDLLSACEERVMGIRVETSFGISHTDSQKFDTGLASFFRNQCKLFGTRIVPGTSKIPVTISNEMSAIKGPVNELNKKSTWKSSDTTIKARPDSVYYEVTIEKEGDVRVGYLFNCRSEPRVEYLGATGELKNGPRTVPYGYPFKAGDVIGCGVIAPDDCNAYAYFVHNGRPLPHVLCRAPPGVSPVVSITANTVGCRMTTRFAAPATWRGEPLADRLLCALDNAQYFPDVCFCFRGSAATVLAHRAILAARCPPLARRCRFTAAAGSPVEVVALDEDAAAFRRLLRYAYSGRVSVADKGELEELFCLASRVGYESLALRCSECLEKASFERPKYTMKMFLERAFGVLSTEKQSYTKLFLEKDISIDDLVGKGVEAAVPRGLVPKPHLRMMADTLAALEAEIAFASRRTVAEPPWVLERDVHRMLKSPQFADIRISVGEKSVMAHRIILAATGEYFKALLQRPFVATRGPGSGGAGDGKPFCLAQEHTISGHVFSTRDGSPEGNPDLFVGDNAVPLDAFMEQMEGDATIDAAIMHFSQDDVVAVRSIGGGDQELLDPNTLTTCRRSVLGIFRKDFGKSNPVEQCFLCKAFVLDREALSMGACSHLVCRACFLARLCAGAAAGVGQGAYRTVGDYVRAVPRPRCPCGNCAKKISWARILAYLRATEGDPIEVLDALAGTEKLQGAEVRREGLPVTLDLTGGEKRVSLGAVECYLAFLYSGYNRKALKARHVWEMGNLVGICPDSQLVAVLRRMACNTAEASAKDLAASNWLSGQAFYEPKNGGVDIAVFVMNHFEEFAIRFSRHPNLGLDAVRKANFYMRRVAPEKEKYPYVVLYAHYAPNGGFLDIDENAFRAARVAPRDALIKYYIGKRVGFEDLRLRARAVVLGDRKVDPAAPSFVKTFGFFGKKCKGEIVEEFVGVVRARMEEAGGKSKGGEDENKACCICGKGFGEKVKCCVCGKMCCNNFGKRKNNCSASVPVVPPEMEWVKAPGIACTLCRKVAIICFLK